MRRSKRFDERGHAGRRGARRRAARADDARGEDRPDGDGRLRRPRRDERPDDVLSRRHPPERRRSAEHQLARRLARPRRAAPPRGPGDPPRHPPPAGHRRRARRREGRGRHGLSSRHRPRRDRGPGARHADRAGDGLRAAGHRLQHELQPGRRRRAGRAVGPHLRELRGEPHARGPDGDRGGDGLPGRRPRRARLGPRLPQALPRRRGHDLGHRGHGRHRPRRRGAHRGPDARGAPAALPGRRERGGDGDHGLVQLVERHQDVRRDRVAHDRAQGGARLQRLSPLRLRRDTAARRRQPDRGRHRHQRRPRHDRRCRTGTPSSSAT